MSVNDTNDITLNSLNKYSLFISLSESSRMPPVVWPLTGVPVLEADCLVGVSDSSVGWSWGVPGRATPSELMEFRWPIRAPVWLVSWGLGVWGLEEVREGKGSSLSSSSRAEALPGSWRESGESGDPGAVVGSAKVLCLTELRLCALTLDQLVERKLSASSQKRTRCSAERVSINCKK